MQWHLRRQLLRLKCALATLATLSSRPQLLGCTAPPWKRWDAGRCASSSSGTHPLRSSREWWAGGRTCAWSARLDVLLSLVLPPPLCSYDEAWALSAEVNAYLGPLTGNAPTGDFFTFVVCPGRHEFSGPHRDKPAAGGDAPSFREADGAPGFVTAWLALTPATPESSCLSFVPACDDAGYRTPGDSLLEVSVGIARRETQTARDAVSR